MCCFEDVRKTIEALIGNLTPAKAQELAKGLSDPGTAKEQVSKMAGRHARVVAAQPRPMREVVGARSQRR